MRVRVPLWFIPDGETGKRTEDPEVKVNCDWQVNLAEVLRSLKPVGRGERLSAK